MKKPTNLYEILIPSTGQVIELKFAAGATEIFCELMGLASTLEIDAALTPPLQSQMDTVGGEVTTSIKFDPTTQFIKAVRLAVYSAAYYAALVQNKPVDFNEWSPSEWFGEVGYTPFFKMLRNEPLEATEQPADSSHSLAQ